MSNSFHIRSREHRHFRLCHKLRQTIWLLVILAFTFVTVWGMPTSSTSASIYQITPTQINSSTIPQPTITPTNVPTSTYTMITPTVTTQVVITPTAPIETAMPTMLSPSATLILTATPMPTATLILTATPMPTATPTLTATPIPTPAPTSVPTLYPISTNFPTITPTAIPTQVPTQTTVILSPTEPVPESTTVPTTVPTTAATTVPTTVPTSTPTPSFVSHPYQPSSILAHCHYDVMIHGPEQIPVNRLVEFRVHIDSDEPIRIDHVGDPGAEIGAATLLYHGETSFWVSSDKVGPLEIVFSTQKMLTHTALEPCNNVLTVHKRVEVLYIGYIPLVMQ
ncbi:MAG: hypothetical protein AAF639_44455 [Chloroflexota bacterium]